MGVAHSSGPPGLLEHFTSSIDTSHSRDSHILEPDSVETDVNTIIKTKGTGSFQLSDDGDQRANYAVDLQISRVDNTDVASGDSSVISGGRSNAASGAFSVVSGGINNKALGDSSVISGGIVNLVTGDHSVVSGGNNNINRGFYSVITGGGYNTINAHYAVVSGGSNNLNNGRHSVITAGFDHINNGEYSVISGGTNHRLHAHYSAIIVGSSNTILENQYQSSDQNKLYAIITSGRNNKLDARYGFIGSGFQNTIDTITDDDNGSSFYPTILNGRLCKIINTDSNYSHSLILNGDENEIHNAAFSTIVNGNNNTINGGSYSTIIGRNNEVTHSGSVLIGRNLISTSSDQVIIGNGNVTSPETNNYYIINSIDPSDGTIDTPATPFTIDPAQILFQAGAYQGESIFTVTKDRDVFVNGRLLVKDLTAFRTTSERASSNGSTIQHEINRDPFLKEYEIREGEKLEKYDVVKIGLDKTVSKYDHKLDGNKEKFVIGVVEEFPSENKCLVRIYGETFVHDKISEFLPQSWIALHKSKNNTNDLCEVFIK